jgi:hypothetical protein
VSAAVGEEENGLANQINFGQCNENFNNDNPYENLTAGLAAHILRGWGFAMAYYILVRRVTLLSAFVSSWFMTIFYWIVFPVWVLTDALPPWI